MEGPGDAGTANLVAPFVVQLRGRLAEHTRRITEHGEHVAELRRSTHTATSKAASVEKLYEKLNNSHSDTQSRLEKLEERLDAWIQRLQPTGAGSEQRVVGIFEGEPPKEKVQQKETWKLHTTTASSAADRRGSFPARRPASNPPSSRSTTSASSVAALILPSALNLSPAKTKQLTELVEMPAVARECDVESELLELRGRLQIIEVALEDYLPKRRSPRSESNRLASASYPIHVFTSGQDGDSQNSCKTRIPEELMQSRLTSMEDSCCHTVGGAGEGAQGNASPHKGGGFTTMGTECGRTLNFTGVAGGAQRSTPPRNGGGNAGPGVSNRKTQQRLPTSVPL